MLTKNQREMMKERKEKSETLDAERRKYIDYTLRNFSKKQLDSIGDVLDVLDVLPGNQIKDIITADRVISVLELLKKLSPHLASIELNAQGNQRAVYRFPLIQKLSNPIEGKNCFITIMKYSFPVEPWEVELANELEPYMHVLTNLFKNEFDEKGGYTLEEWNKFGFPLLHDIITRRGQPFEWDCEGDIFIGAEKIPCYPPSLNEDQPQ